MLSTGPKIRRYIVLGILGGEMTGFAGSRPALRNTSAQAVVASVLVLWVMGTVGGFVALYEIETDTRTPRDTFRPPVSLATRLYRRLFRE